MQRRRTILVVDDEESMRHFLTKTLPRVSTEMSLHVLAYNMKRVMNLLGVGTLIEAMRA